MENGLQREGSSSSGYQFRRLAFSIDTVQTREQLTNSLKLDDSGLTKNIASLPNPVINNTSREGVGQSGTDLGKSRLRHHVLFVVSSL